MYDFIQYRLQYQIVPKYNRSCKTEHNKIEQKRTGHIKTEQNRAEKRKTKNNRTEQDGTVQNRTEQNCELCVSEHLIWSKIAINGIILRYKTQAMKFNRNGGERFRELHESYRGYENVLNQGTTEA